MEPIFIPTTIDRSSMAITYGKDGKVLSIVFVPNRTSPSTQLLSGDEYWIGGKGTYKLPNGGFVPAILAAAGQQNIPKFLLTTGIADVVVSCETLSALLCARDIRAPHLDRSKIEVENESDIRFVRIKNPTLRSLCGTFSPNVLVYFTRTDKIRGRLGRTATIYFDAFDGSLGAPVAEPVENKLAGKNNPVLNYTNQMPIVEALKHVHDKTGSPANWAEEAIRMLKPATTEGGVYDYTVSSPVPEAVVFQLCAMGLINYEGFSQAAFGHRLDSINDLIEIIRGPAVTDRRLFEIILSAISK